MHSGRLVGRERARSEENGLSTATPTLEPAPTTLAEGATDPATEDDFERFLPGLKNRQRRSRAPSLPSVSFLVGDKPGANPGQGGQGLTEGRWGSMIGSAVVEARDGTMVVREGSNSPDLAEGKTGSSGAEQGELNDGIGGWPRRETAGTSDKKRGLSEEELLGESSQCSELDEEERLAS